MSIAAFRVQVLELELFLKLPDVRWVRYPLSPDCLVGWGLRPDLLEPLVAPLCSHPHLIPHNTISGYSLSQIILFPAKDNTISGYSLSPSPSSPPQPRRPRSVLGAPSRGRDRGRGGQPRWSGLLIRGQYSDKNSEEKSVFWKYLKMWKFNIFRYILLKTTIFRSIIILFYRRISPLLTARGRRSGTPLLSSHCATARWGREAGRPRSDQWWQTPSPRPCRSRSPGPRPQARVNTFIF